MTPSRLSSIPNLLLNTHPNSEKKSKVLKSCKEYSNIFIVPGDKLTFTNTVKHKIKTKNEEPMFSKSYSPHIHKEEAHNQNTNRNVSRDDPKPVQREQPIFFKKFTEGHKTRARYKKLQVIIDKGRNLKFKNGQFHRKHVKKKRKVPKTKTLLQDKDEDANKTRKHDKPSSLSPDNDNTDNTPCTSNTTRRYHTRSVAKSNLLSKT